MREILIDRERVFYDSNRAAHYHLYDVDNGELHEPEGTWTFVDWKKGLYKDIAAMGAFVWALRRCAELASATGREAEGGKLVAEANRIELE